MAGIQLGDDVSILNVEESRAVTNDSYSRRSTLLESSGLRVSNIYNLNRGAMTSIKPPEQRELSTEVLTEGFIRSGAPENRAGKTESEVMLRDKVSSLFRENCGLKEQAAKLSIDNRMLQKQIGSFKQENSKLKEKLHQCSQQLKVYVQNKETNFSDGSKFNVESEEWDRNLKLNKTKYFNGLPDSNEFDQSCIKKDLSPPRFQTLENQRPFQEEESQREKELMELLESCQKNCKMMKQAALGQNKLLMEAFQKISSLQKLNIVPPSHETSSSTRVISNDIIEHKNNVIPDVDQLIHTYAPHLVNWTGEGNKIAEETNDMIVEDNWICPMCQAVFPKAVPLMEFELHVIDHFKSDEFEIIPQDGEFS